MGRASYFAAAIGVLAAACQPSEPVTYDFRITGGTVYDGVSSDGRLIDVFIDEDRIVYVGDASEQNMTADTVIDATGLVVAPGFIDPHTHTLSDVLFSDDGKRLNGYLTQGVSTVVAGNDGGGPVDVAGSLRAADARGTGANFALFAGHNSIRAEVMGRENRVPTDAELSAMQDLLAQALDHGALGFSTGLYYAPGSYAQRDEITALARIAAEHEALYESHIRDESSYSVGLLGAIDEAIQIGRDSGAAVHIAHIKALGVDVWGQSADVIARIEAAQADGVTITADQYPWSASGTRISNALIPNWAKADSDEAMFERLRDPGNQERLIAEVTENLRKRGGSDAILLVARVDGLPSRTLTDEAAAMNLDPVRAAIEIVLRGDARIASFNMQDDDIERFMTQPWVMTSSDGTNGHPRKYASFPRKYATYVRDTATLSLADFINRSTRLTAETLQLCDRGQLKPGFYADIVIFDPARFAPVADFSNPAELSVGVEHLFVNGGRAIADGALSEELHGVALRRAVCDQNKESVQ